MTHTYQISGMTCKDCAAKVRSLIEKVNGIQLVHIDQAAGQAHITMQHHIATPVLQAALAGTKYGLSEKKTVPVIPAEPPVSWWTTYRPVLLVFAFITGTTLLVQAGHPFDPMQWMNHFMAGFFIVFSFFKLLNLRGFADSYSTYDIVARRWRPYAFIYAFTELALGLAYLSGFMPFVTNLVTVVIMAVSLVGVLQSVLNKRKIRCACLGEVFNLPMSTITVMEDALMLLMAGYMLTLVA